MCIRDSVQGYDVKYYKNEKSVVVLGSGAYRIGSSVEFDWCSVNAIQTEMCIRDSAVAIDYSQGDSLFMHGDTLRLITYHMNTCLLYTSRCV